MRDLPAERSDWKSYDILVVDDEEDNLDAFRFAFRKAFTLHYALGGQAALDLCDRVDPAVIVSDQRMPGMNGIELLTRAKERRPDAFGVLLTAYADLAVLIDAVNSGAVDRYIQKPWDSKELTVILRQGIQSFATVRENRRLREQLSHYAGYLEREQRDPIDFGQLAGESPAMRQISARIAEVGPTSTHVLLEGEPGVEADVVARAIHVGSPREDRPFVRVTCAAFRGPGKPASGDAPIDALERELFGWWRGAFEGAFDDRAGRLELADGGTLYLDDPAVLAPSLQARLERLLSSGEVERIGATQPSRVDVRIVTRLCPSLEETWGRAGVLPDIASRLGVFPIRLPPLRERTGDVRALAEHFLRSFGRRNARAAVALAPDAIARLEAYAWPGNVRELENVVERAAILARGDVVHAEHLAFDAQRGSAAAAAPAPEVDAPRDQSVPLASHLEEIERRELLAALARYGGNKAEVARSLGVQRTTLYYRLKRLGIE